MERCPNCRARCDGGPACRRCGMDLGLLLALERAAQRELRNAVAHLAAGELDVAATAAQRALALHRTPVAERVAGFVDARQARARRDRAAKGAGYVDDGTDAGMDIRELRVRDIRPN